MKLLTAIGVTLLVGNIGDFFFFLLLLRMSLKHVQRQQLLLTMSVLVIVAFSGLR